MSRISEKTIDDALQKLSGIVPLDVNLAVHEMTISCFICAIGFEDRCIELSTQLKECKARLGLSVILKLDSNSDADKKNEQVLKEMLSSISDEVKVLNVDSDDYTEQLSKILENLSCEKLERVIFDISVGANRLILRTMGVFFETNIALEIWYSEAETYHPTRKEFKEHEDQWMSENELGTEMGVQNVSPSLEFNGEHQSTLPDTVILFPSFRHERSAAVISYVDEALLMSPGNHVVWILGIPHYPEDIWRREAMRLINRIKEDAYTYDASTFDYKDTYRILNDIYQQKWQTTNITLSALGSKLQAIAISLFCFQHPDIRVVFSTPKHYNTKQWSDGCRSTWKIPFGSMGDVRNCLSQVGCIELDDN